MNIFGGTEEVTGGGTAQLPSGEISYCDIHNVKVWLLSKAAGLFCEIK